jgi:hypothetical protein
MRVLQGSSKSSDAAVPPQDHVSDAVSVGFRGQSYVPMQERGKVEGSPLAER